MPGFPHWSIPAAFDQTVVPQVEVLSKGTDELHAVSLGEPTARKH